jgi:two-component sensor histidine kinase
MIGDQQRVGYGTGLVRDIIPHELGGKVELLYRTSGVDCAIIIPAAQVRWP